MQQKHHIAFRSYSTTLTIDIVGDLSSIVQQAELVPFNGLTSLVVHHLVSDKVVVVPDSLSQLVQEGRVSDLPRAQALLVQHGYDSLVPLLHEVTDDLVVKVLDGLPLKVCA